MNKVLYALFITVLFGLGGCGSTYYVQSGATVPAASPPPVYVTPVCVYPEIPALYYGRPVCMLPPQVYVYPVYPTFGFGLNLHYYGGRGYRR